MKKNGLASLRAVRDWTQEHTAMLAGLSLGGYRKLEYGERELKAAQIEKFARLFDASEAEVMGREGRATVPLVGYVGAGAEAHFYASADDPRETVDAPDGATDDTVAVEIHGESLGPLFDRWIVFYDEVRSPVTPDLIGRLCVVGLIDDRVLVKKIQRSRSGAYILLSNTEAPMVDVEIAWAARVRNMVPR
ncbi:helix-turn-helix domain-containing protein [Mesorhizobium sp. BR1-1-16]|nr:helix-turn-helix domain-containing protein [Mesorhizobium sp. BR1-1-16]